MEKSSEYIFKEKSPWTNLQKEKSPMNKSSLKIFKSSKEKSPTDKSSLKFFKIAMEKSPEWIFKEKSPWINLFFFFLIFKCLKDKSSR